MLRAVVHCPGNVASKKIDAPVPVTPAMAILRPCARPLVPEAVLMHRALVTDDQLAVEHDASASSIEAVGSALAKARPVIKTDAEPDWGEFEGRAAESTGAAAQPVGSSGGRQCKALAAAPARSPPSAPWLGVAPRAGDTKRAAAFTVKGEQLTSSADDPADSDSHASR